MFKRKKKHNINAKVVAKVSCEDPNTLYFEFPDGLRLIFRDGEYDGWYVA